MNDHLDREIIEALIKRQKKRICSLAYCYMKNMDDVQDVYQMVFEKFIRSMPEFRDENHEDAWFITTTANTCKSLCKTAWKRHVSSMDEMTQEQIDTTLYEETKRNKSDGEWEDDNRLLEQVLQLPEKYRTVIHLYYYEDYSVKEIAGFLGLSESVVKTRLNRGRNKLRDAVKVKVSTKVSEEGGMANVRSQQL